MSKSIYFFLNGNEYFSKSKITILDLLNYFKYNQSLLIVEYNNVICDKKSWSKILIKTNDNIEIITIVGGG